jgi:hypothetical protein
MQKMQDNLEKNYIGRIKEFIENKVDKLLSDNTQKAAIYTQ